MHSQRKGFGCRYAGKVPAQVLQKLMRHRNIRTTMDFYANVDDAVEAAVRAECNGQGNTPPRATEGGERVVGATAGQPSTSGLRYRRRKMGLPWRRNLRSKLVR
jgi:hypothetical protein